MLVLFNFNLFRLPPGLRLYYSPWTLSRGLIEHLGGPYDGQRPETRPNNCTWKPEGRGKNTLVLLKKHSPFVLFLLGISSTIMYLF